MSEAKIQRVCGKLVDREVGHNVGSLVEALASHQDPCVWTFDPDAIEFWIVTEWFAEKLESHGETCVDVHGLHVWGRCCSGQAILLDSVVRDIAEEMQILPGQQFEWHN